MSTLDFVVISLTDYLASVEIFQLVLLGVVEHACDFEVALRLFKIMFVIEIVNELVSKFLVLLVTLVHLLIICVGFVILSTARVWRLQGCEAGIVFSDCIAANHRLEGLICSTYSQVIL